MKLREFRVFKKTSTSLATGKLADGYEITADSYGEGVKKSQKNVLQKNFNTKKLAVLEPI